MKFSKVRRRKVIGVIGVALLILLFLAFLISRVGGGGKRDLNTSAKKGVSVQSGPPQTTQPSSLAMGDKDDDDNGDQSTHAPMTSDPTKPLAIIHTDHGDITWELFPEEAPVTVANFARMSREGVFNRSCFYRYEKGFVLQGGLHCNRPPPHHGKAKNVPLEYKRRNEKYTVALARAGGDLNSGGTEFFINLRDNSNTLGPGKKGGYAVFAAVVDGMDTIAALKKLPTKTAGLTRFVSPQPVIEYIEIRNLVGEAIDGDRSTNDSGVHEKAKVSGAHSGGGKKGKTDAAEHHDKKGGSAKKVHNLKQKKEEE